MNEAEEIVHKWLEREDDVADNLYLTNLNLTHLPDNFPYDRVEHFFCWGNRLTCLDLPNVMNLNCDDNQIVSLNVPKAIFVSCMNNRLESLCLPEVMTLFCDCNPIRQITTPKLKCLFDSITPHAFMRTSFYSVYRMQYVYSFKYALKKRIHQKRIQTVRNLNLFDEIGLNRCVEDYMSSSFVKHER